MKKILRRVKLDLTKKFGKNLLKCVVFIVLFSMLGSSLYIQSIAKRLEDSIVEKFDIYVDINPNIDSEETNMDTYLQKTIEYEKMIRDLANNTNASYYDFNLTSTPYKSLLKTVKIENETITHFYDGGTSPVRNEELLEDIKQSMLLSSAIKSVRNSTPKDFQMNAAYLVAGRMFDEDEILNGERVCIIPASFRKYKDEKLANLWVDDEIVISEFVQDEKNEIVHYKNHTYKVIGVYETSDNGSMKTMDGFLEMPIYIPELSFKGMIEPTIEVAKNTYNHILYGSRIFMVHPTIFQFSSIEDYKEFIQYLEKYSDKFHGEYTYSSTMETQFSSISNILSISKSISYISMLCLIACVCITFILLLFDVETSKKEIGILLSFGESLKEVVMQYVLEMILISIVSVVISFGVIQTVGVGVANALVQEQLTKEETVQLNDSDYEIEVEHYEEILKPISFVDNLRISSLYIVGLCVFESFVLIVLIKKVDPKDLMKDS